MFRFLLLLSLLLLLRARTVTLPFYSHSFYFSRVRFKFRFCRTEEVMTSSRAKDRLSFRVVYYRVWGNLKIYNVAGETIVGSNRPLSVIV